jgi:hypothetical protein
MNPGRDHEAEKSEIIEAQKPNAAQEARIHVKISDSPGFSGKIPSH